MFAFGIRHCDGRGDGIRDDGSAKPWSFSHVTMTCHRHESVLFADVLSEDVQRPTPGGDEFVLRGAPR